MPKLDFESALQKINDQMPVDPADIQAAALRRRIWIARSNYPGCMPEYTAITTTRREAIASLMAIADCGDGPPRGMATALRQHGRCRHAGINYSIAKSTLGDLLYGATPEIADLLRDYDLRIATIRHQLLACQDRMYLRCAACMGRGHRSRSCSRTIRGVRAMGTYTYPCPTCNGAGSRPVRDPGLAREVEDLRAECHRLLMEKKTLEQG